MSGVSVIDEYREKNGIALLLSQPWPAAKDRDFRVSQRERAELELRVTRCARCGTESDPLDGPTGRAWFKTHSKSCGRVA